MDFKNFKVRQARVSTNPNQKHSKSHWQGETKRKISKLQVNQRKFYQKVKLIWNKIFSAPEITHFKHYKTTLQVNPNLYETENPICMLPKTKMVTNMADFPFKQ